MAVVSGGVGRCSGAGMDSAGPWATEVYRAAFWAGDIRTGTAT
jgi:hypothetical protein